MNLDDPPIETKQSWIAINPAATPAIKRQTVRQRGDHHVKKADGGEVIHAVGPKLCAFCSGQMKQPSEHGGGAAEQTGRKRDRSAKENKPGEIERQGVLDSGALCN